MNKFGKKKKIFISYRRDDSAGQAGRIYDTLCQHFGAQQIFMDIDNIEPGIDFIKAMEDAVSSCDVLLAIVGRSWFATDDKNTRRIDSPTDFVQLEIATALTRGIRVIPVLVQDAAMPSSQSLPDNLKDFARRNALEISDLHWKSGVQRLVNVINRIPPTDDARRPVEIPGTRYPKVIRLAMILGLAGLCGLIVLVWQIRKQTKENLSVNSIQNTANSSPTPISSFMAGSTKPPSSSTSEAKAKPSPEAKASPTLEAKAKPSPTLPIRVGSIIKIENQEYEVLRIIVHGQGEEECGTATWYNDECDRLHLKRLFDGKIDKWTSSDNYRRSHPNMKYGFDQQLEKLIVIRY